MIEGRYLLGVEPPEKTILFLHRLADLTVEEDWLREQGMRAHAARSARGAPAQPVAPCPPTHAEHLQRVRARPLFQGLFGACDFEFGLVDLASLIPVQPHVDFTFATATVPEQLDEETILELCLPASPQPIDAWGGVTEVNGQGSFTVCSQDLNLVVSEVHMDSDPLLKVTFTLSKSAVFLVVVEAQGRLFLKDGTHRAVGLLARGTAAAPCVIVHGPSHRAAVPEHLPRETLFGERPPWLADFLEPALHIPHAWRRGLKIIRIRPDEFMVSQDSVRA